MLKRSLRFPGLALVVLALIALMATAMPNHTVRAASLVQISNFGPNPSNLGMYLYVPASVKPLPPILVAVHWCTGSGPAFYSGTEFASLADKYGFIIIYPSATRSGHCFDVSSPQSLTHNGGSDPVGIMSMITYVEQHNNGDPNRVYVTGASSGGMMTNVLIGDYPDVFKAGAAFMGVPFGCFATTDGSLWNNTCSSGNLHKTPQEWGDIVRGAYPGYTGPRPRMQLWHGVTDTTLNYANFGEEIKEWTNVLGVSQTPSFTDTPQSGWTRTRYGSTGIGAPVEGISVAGVGHSLPLSGMAAMAIQFFGLDTTSTSPTQTSTATSSIPTNTPTRTVVGPTNTPSSTPVKPTSTVGIGGGACSPVNATISAPFSFDGVGNLCWRSNSLGSYINSWNLGKLSINGVDFTNKYGTNSQLPAKSSDGYWYISYSSTVAWGHFEAK